MASEFGLILPILDVFTNSIWFWKKSSLIASESLKKKCRKISYKIFLNIGNAYLSSYKLIYKKKLKTKHKALSSEIEDMLFYLIIQLKF